MQHRSNSFQSVCAVVVTFYPPQSTEVNIRSLVSQQIPVVVVDNTPGEAGAVALQQIAALHRVTVIRSGKNLGIAAALNQGIQLAIQSGAEWVATFDQDSCVTPGFFNGLLAAFHKCPERDRVFLVAPLLFYPESNELQVTNAAKLPESSFIRTAMTSGSLIRTEIFSKLGNFDEGLFIDYVDYDHCLRAQAAGYRLLRANRALLHHRLGTPEKHSLFGRKIAIKSHSAWRRYYITRNRFLMYRRYAFSFPGWCLRDFGWFFLELGKVLVFERDKFVKLRKIAKGLAHAALGKTGQLVPPG